MNETKERTRAMNEDRHDGNGTRRPSQIMAEINRTRDEMDRTLHAIENRLTPGQLVDQGLDYLKNSGAREYASNLGSSVKTNPLPTALVGIGLAWLMAVGNRPQQRSSYEYQGTGSGSTGGIGDRMQSAKDSLTGSMQSTKDTLSGKMQSTKDSLTGSVQSAKDSVSSGVQSAKDSLTGTMQSAKDSLQSARDRASQLGGTARRQVERARSGYDTMLNEHPLALGAVGLAIGAVAAAVIPRTRKEDEMMGEARDNLVDQAKQAGGEKLEQAKQVAASAKDTIVNEAQKAKPAQGASNPKPPQGATSGANPKPAQGAPVTGTPTSTPSTTAPKPQGASNQQKPRTGEPPDPLKWPGSRG
jgi:ElaB/YqjD/DUF883 family membrane-anchored ribosome-binding protein